MPADLHGSAIPFTQSPATSDRPLADLLHDVRAFIRRYVVLDDDQAVAVALYAAHTHAIDAADCTPYLAITSATKRAGKTRQLEVLEPLVRTPWLTGRTSAAALVRKTDEHAPTLLLDETDAAFSGEKEYSEALRGILNSGYRRSGRVTLCVGQGANLTTQDFGTFGPKVLAGIGALPDTVADRSIRIVLRRRRTDEPCQKWRERDGHAAAAPLRAGLARWAAGAIDRLRGARPAVPAGLGDRQADVWEPLLAIADEAGGDWSPRARRAAVALTGAADDQDITVELLTDIADILLDDSRDHVPSAELLAALVKRDDRPWADWRQGRPLTARGLARLLAPLSIYPSQTERLRGYRRSLLDDAIARYLPSHVCKRHEPNKDGHEHAISMCAEGEALHGSPSVSNPIDTGSDHTCTDTQPETPPRDRFAGRPSAPDDPPWGITPEGWARLKRQGGTT